MVTRQSEIRPNIDNCQLFVSTLVWLSSLSLSFSPSDNHEWKAGRPGRPGRPGGHTGGQSGGQIWQTQPRPALRLPAPRSETQVDVREPDDIWCLASRHHYNNIRVSQYHNISCLPPKMIIPHTHTRHLESSLRE